jgi:hypothetical protein
MDVPVFCHQLIDILDDQEPGLLGRATTPDERLAYFRGYIEATLARHTPTVDPCTLREV